MTNWRVSRTNDIWKMGSIEKCSPMVFSGSAAQKGMTWISRTGIWSGPDQTTYNKPPSQRDCSLPKKAIWKEDNGGGYFGLKQVPGMLVQTAYNSTNKAMGLPSPLKQRKRAYYWTSWSSVYCPRDYLVQYTEQHMDKLAIFAIRHYSRRKIVSCFILCNPKKCGGVGNPPSPAPEVFQMPPHLDGLHFCICIFTRLEALNNWAFPLPLVFITPSADDTPFSPL
jgi:hypothetical protein